MHVVSFAGETPSPRSWSRHGDNFRGVSELTLTPHQFRGMSDGSLTELGLRLGWVGLVDTRGQLMAKRKIIHAN